MTAMTAMTIATLAFLSFLIHGESLVQNAMRGMILDDPSPEGDGLDHVIVAASLGGLVHWESAWDGRWDGGENRVD